MNELINNLSFFVDTAVKYTYNINERLFLRCVIIIVLK